MHFGMWMKWSCFIWYSLNVNLNTYENNVQNIIYLQGSSTFDTRVIYNIIWLGYSYLEDIMCSIVLQYKTVVENIIRIYFWAIFCKITLFDSCLLYLAKPKNTVIQSIMKEYFSTLHFMYIFFSILFLNADKLHHPNVLDQVNYMYYYLTEVFIDIRGHLRCTTCIGCQMRYNICNTYLFLRI